MTYMSNHFTPQLIADEMAAAQEKIDYEGWATYLMVPLALVCVVVYQLYFKKKKATSSPGAAQQAQNPAKNRTF